MDGMNNQNQGGAMQMQMQQQMPPQQMMGQMIQDPMQMMQQQNPGQFNGMQMQQQPQMNQGMVGGYGFAAKPRVVQQKRYRDPYREYVKVAPQNIMYDRRVVRGNTFAALVIPVNMQPDPALIEKQKMEEAYMKQRQEEMRMRRQQEKMRHEQMQENQNNMQMVQMQSANMWEELSDHQNMVDEFELEPDYYIDRAPDAIFIPNPEGEIKATQIFDRDPDLFDYENEVEPILQVLVGKSIEHARIEVIEEYEASELKKHKKKYFQIKEAELMETQRLEENRARKSDEVDRRNSQMRLTKGIMQATEKKVIARLFAKNFLSKFKRDTMRTMIDLGALRRPVDLSTGATFVPQMYNQIQFDMQQYHDHQDQMDEMLNESMCSISILHKQSIVKELNKRQERKKEEMRKKRQEEDERRQRKERRAALREKKRLEDLKEQIQQTIIVPATLDEYSPKTRIYDVRDPNATDDGVILIGGFVGELIITFTCLSDYILASPQNQNFFFTVESIENFLTDLFGGEDSQFPDGTCCINLTKTVEDLSGGKNLTSDMMAKIARDQANIADFGLNYMFDVQKELVLNPDVIEVIYRAICKVAMQEPVPLQELPVVPEDADDDKKDEINEQIEEVKKKNEDIEKENAKIARIKNKVQIQGVPDRVYDEESEKALLKLNNHRDAAAEQAILSARTGQSNPDGTPVEVTEDSFNFEKIPVKIPKVKPINADGIQIAAYHSEAPYNVRKVLLEQAKKNFKEVEKAEANFVTSLINHSSQRTKMMEERFEEMFIKTQGYGRGCQHNDVNTRITFKTFLQE